MKVRTLIVAIALLIAAFILVAVKPKPRTPDDATLRTSGADTETNAPAAIQNARNDIAIMGAVASSQTHEQPRRGGHLEELGSGAGISTQQALAQMTNLDKEVKQTVNVQIDFYGKVVEDGDSPVKSATVHFGALVFPDRQFKTNVLSDANGLFALNNATGAALTVRITKEGYEEVPGANENRFLYYSPSSEGYRANSNAPVIFRLRKKT